MNLAEELIRWIIFSTTVAFLPIFFRFIKGFESDGANLSFLNLFSGGELFLISGVIAAGSIGELLGEQCKHGFIELICGGSCLLLSVTSFWWFACLNPAQNQLNLTTRARFSVVFFILSVITGSVCILIGYI